MIKPFSLITNLFLLTLILHQNSTLCSSSKKPSSLKRPRDEAPAVTEFACEICTEVFDCAEKLKNHRKNHGIQCKKIACAICYDLKRYANNDIKTVFASPDIQGLSAHMFKAHGALHKKLNPTNFIKYFATLKCPRCDHTSECKVSLSVHINNHDTAVSEKHAYCKIKDCNYHNSLKWMYRHLANIHKDIMKSKGLVDVYGLAIRHSLRTCTELCTCKKDKLLIKALNEQLYKGLLAYPQKNSGTTSAVSSSTSGGGGSGAAAQAQDASSYDDGEDDAI